MGEGPVASGSRRRIVTPGRSAIGGLVLALVLLPLVGGQYAQYVAIQVLILSLFALGFNILFGYTGLLSFGQAGFYAVGAYGCAKLLLLTPSLLFGVVGMMIFSMALKWRDFTGGDDGLVGIPRAPLEIPGLVSISMASMGRYYYFVLAVSLVAIAIAYRLVHSPLGLTFQGIRDSEGRMAFTGVSVRTYRLIAFVIAGLYAGLAGALLPALENTVTPPVAHWTTSADPVLATLLGGIQAFAGPIVGAFLFFMIKDIIVRFTEYWLIWLGVIVVVLVMGFRGGVVSLATARWRALRPGREGA
ncbi:MAG: branched-chain amino acid ABC transporter permease [candidate division NC10 bacterium]|nr:branched-chain amino acid ABC transporter permease [candidate division NC10 bacterium]